MSELAELLKNQLDQLPKADRAELAKFLLHSLDDEDDQEERQDVVDEAWKQELVRRVAEIKSGKVQLVSGDDVIARTREKYP